MMVLIYEMKLNVAEAARTWVTHSLQRSRDSSGRRDDLYGTHGAWATGSEFEFGQDTLRNVSVQGAAMAFARA